MNAQTPAPQIESERPLDPNVLQRRASNPEASVWVSASAGTGKTKVLTDRVLRLLLPQDNGASGCNPNKILGLTFTKAAASEMALRINETLSNWAIMPLDGKKGLTATLTNLLGHPPKDTDIAAARKLFADVIDTPGRLKIMTIHSFCQSILARFPLEAKLTPGFEVADDRTAQDYLTQAKQRVFKTAITSKSTPLSNAIQNLSRNINEDQLNQLIQSIASERRQLNQILEQNFGVDGFYTSLCQTLDITPDQSERDILLNSCKNESFARDAMKSCADIMASGTKTDIKNATIIHDFLAADIDARIKNFNAYKEAFLTQKNEPRAKFITKGLGEKNPQTLDILQTEADRILKVLDTIRSTQMASLTRDLIITGIEILTHYETIKSYHNTLDYEDLIFKTSNLLENTGQWVHYKLDEGIDHILIDEAQDTNPEQWKIIEALCGEFFASHTAPEEHAKHHRTIFTVGDEKQSIYSFQRASPEEFDRMRNHFAEKITAAQQNWQKIDLNISFRSTKSVLAAVDAVFASPQTGQGLGIGEINHESFRRGQAGTVELWPLFENDEEAKDSGTTWDPPITIQNQKSGATKLAESIADKIAHWINTKETLPSHDRAIEAGDVMILVRTRNAFVNQLIRALKTRDIPVGGLDRIVLNEQLAVQDMLAAANFALLPTDDLTLACLLKSPLIGIDEDTLFTLAYNRKASLWDSVRQNAPENITAYLNALQSKARNLTPYAFLADILQSPCPADTISALRSMQKRLGIDALDALDEILNAAINFERDHTPSLQGFLHWQQGGAGDIKRQSDDQSNHVRIMTVHGSKGLQAPIVFLPDTVGTPGLNASQASNRLLWPTKTNLKHPLWAPRKDMEADAYTNAKDTVQTRLNEEYRRLLYVAMTRAEDKLFVTGHKGKRYISDDCWFSLVKNGLKNHDNHEILENGIIRLQNTQTKDADRQPKQRAQSAEHSPIPDWMYKPAPQEPTPPAPLIPSRPSESQDESPALSPLKSADNYRFRRGNVTHTLLQFLPDLPHETRIDSATTYLNTHANDLPESVRTNIITEITKILNNDNFAPLFSAASRAEVPLTGLLPDGRLISGQIDRLLITDDQILIVDFKTNRPPPNDPKDVPQIYYSQLKSYADVLQSIYPNRAIKCALLWTDGPNLMPINLE